MFLTSNNYEKQLTSIIAEDGKLLAAVAFWGRGAESIITLKRLQTIRLICNLRSGATNPSTIDSLRKQKGVEVKQHDRLHAKVIVGPKTALVGSANISSNGLNFEGDEVGGWEEAAIVTRDASHLDAIRQWFTLLWRDAREVSDADLNEAKERWAQRRATRFISRPTDKRNGFSLNNLTESDLAEHRAFLTIYTGFLSSEAKAAYRKKQKELTDQPMVGSAKLPPMYENWPKLPKDSYLIDLYYGPRGSLKCFGVFTTVFDIKFKYKHGERGHLWICRKENDVFGLRFRSQESNKLAKTLKPNIKKIWDSHMAKGDKSGKIISLADVVRLCD
ncbi:MAG: phospholipase D family protein [Dehalococcoidales bacterium]|nr:phospholipase D family protein [Dehalococcoidales bacterium]